MITIFKYELPIKSCVELKLPLNHKALSVHNQREKLVVYIQLDDEAECTEVVKFYISGTGHEIPSHSRMREYIGTAMFDDGLLVWHVFKEKV